MAGIQTVIDFAFSLVMVVCAGAVLGCTLAVFEWFDRLWRY